LRGIHSKNEYLLNSTANFKPKLMNKNLTIQICLLFLLLTGCQYENAISLYNQGDEIKPLSNTGLLAHITFDKSIKDIGENKMPVAIQGEAVFVKGVDGTDSSAIQLKGYPQSISISNLGMNDTLAIFMWFKAGDLLAKTDSFTLFDYGVKSFALKIDGTTGATLINTTHNNQQNTINDWINSSNIWNYLYAEAGGGKLKVMYQGAMKNKQLITIDVENESPGILNPLTDILYIGRSSTGENVNRSYFKGSIDNIRIYNRPLSKSEVFSIIHEDITNKPAQ
jgi:hypothetical protein